MEFFLENAGTIVIALALLAAVGLIIRNIIKKKRRGQCAGCDGCDKGGGCDRSGHHGGNPPPSADGFPL